MDTAIIKACLNGGRGREECPTVPWTPEEIASEAVRAAEAGAAIVHIHGRTPDGRPSYASGTYSRIVELIRARSDVLINFSTLREPDRPIEAVESFLYECDPAPDMVSLNLGAIVSQRYDAATGQAATRIIPSSLEDVLRINQACVARGIVPEAAVLDAGMFNLGGTLIRRGLLSRFAWFLLEFGPSPGEGFDQRMPGTVEELVHLAGRVEREFPGARWCAHGREMNTFPIAAAALAMGGHVRVGMEDGVRLPGGAAVRSNAEMVAWAVNIARALGREPASPEEARRLLGLTAPEG